jgi:hypothetical protein
VTGLASVVELVALEVVEPGSSFVGPWRVDVNEPEVLAPVGVCFVEDVFDVLSAVGFGDAGDADAAGVAVEDPAFAPDPCADEGPVDEFAREFSQEPVGVRAWVVDLYDDRPFGHGSRVRPSAGSGQSQGAGC